MTQMSALLQLLRTTICNQNNTTGATNGAETAFPSKAPEMTPGVQWSLCCSIFSFHVLFYRSLIVLLLFFCLPLYYLFFVDLRVWVIPLVSSNFSYVLSLLTRSFIPSFCNIILGAPPLFFQCNHLPLYFVICLFVLVVIIAT